MKHRYPISTLISVFIATSFLFGCAAGPSVFDERPWYRMSSGAYDTPHGSVFFGIGKAEGSANATLLRATAVNRARTALSRVLDAYVAELFQATQATPALTMEEGEQVIGELVRNALKFSAISDQWSDPERGGIYALCRLDLERFKQVLASQTNIDAAVRGAMAAEAENVHAMLVSRTN